MPLVAGDCANHRFEFKQLFPVPVGEGARASFIVASPVVLTCQQGSPPGSVNVCLDDWRRRHRL
jgi:hypothetical protein